MYKFIKKYYNMKINLKKKSILKDYTYAKYFKYCQQ